MTIAMQPIYTQTVGSGGAASITFNNIPQTFTDLALMASTRTSFAGFEADLSILPNTDGSSIGSATRVAGNGSTAFSQRNSNVVFALGGTTLGTSATANTFNNYQAYFPNYAGNNFKQILIDSVNEGNYTNNITLVLGAYLWRSTNAITSLYVVSGGSFVQHSTFTLYGITKG
jgi:hypothetical protein